MAALSTYRIEIERLHAFLIAWFTATAVEDAFGEFERSIAPDFEMVSPNGERTDRSAVLESIHGAYGHAEPGSFDIDVRNVELVQEVAGYATVRYEEWQETPAGTTGRISTVLLREDPGAPGGFAWVDLHETWID